jgi:hypothetical protein
VSRARFVVSEIRLTATAQGSAQGNAKIGKIWKKVQKDGKSAEIAPKGIPPSVRGGALWDGSLGGAWLGRPAS